MPKFRNVLLLVVLIIVDPDLLGSSRFSSAAVKPSGCDKKVIIPHGFVTFIEDDSVILFECFNGYVPYGEMKATCQHGKWDAQPPQCIKKGCNQLKIPIHGKIKEEYSGALARFYCDAGYELEGEAVLTCNGKAWNGISPTCNKLPRKVLKHDNKTDL